MGYIYLITNIDDGKKYVGQTREENVETRWKAHTKESSNCIYLKRALKKYGIEKFKFEIIILCFDEDMNDYEMEYIEKFNTVIPNGYNITKGGSGWKGKHSEATKEKLRKINKEYYSNIENRLRLGIKVKEGMKNINISERMLKSEKWINALKEGRVGGNKKSTPVIQLDDDKNEIAKYSSINEAARQLSTNVSRISIALKNNTRTGRYRICLWREYLCYFAKVEGNWCR